MACAMSVVKYLVFIFNLICALAGLAFIAVGVVFKLSFDEYSKALSQDNTPSFLIALGVIVFVISFFGCCGAVRESSCMLTTYAVILLVLFILQVAVGVYAFLQYRDNQTEVKSTLKSNLVTQFESYGKSAETKEMIDTLQEAFECCGVDGPTDWYKWKTLTVVSSCCAGKPDVCKLSEAYQAGCFNTVWDFLHKSVQIIGIVALSIGAIEVVGAIVALCLSSSLRNRDRRDGYYY